MFNPFISNNMNHLGKYEYGRGKPIKVPPDADAVLPL